MTGVLPANEAHYLNDIKGYLNELKPKDKKELFQAIVDAPFIDKTRIVRLDLGIVVLLLVNKETKMIDRIALSKTKMAKGAVSMSAKPFSGIKIPLSNKQNIIGKAIENGKIQETSDWHDLFVPDLTSQQARFNQSGAGIDCSVVSKLEVKDGGAMIFSFYQPLEDLRKHHYDFIEQYSQLAEETLKDHSELF